MKKSGIHEIILCYAKFPLGLTGNLAVVFRVIVVLRHQPDPG